MRRAVDWQNFTAALGWLAEAFNKELSMALLEVYWEALKDIPWDGLRWAVAQHLRDGKHFPRPAELREHYQKGYVSAAAKVEQLRERSEAERIEREDKVLRSNPILFQQRKERMARMTDHFNDHEGGLRKGCEVCAEAKKHPNPHLHVVNGWLPEDIDDNPVEGCCK